MEDCLDKSRVTFAAATGNLEENLQKHHLLLLLLLLLNLSLFVSLSLFFPLSLQMDIHVRILRTGT